MQFEDIYVVSDKRKIVTDEQTSIIERALNIQFPIDLRAFLIRFGSGEFCGCLSVFDPQTILEGQKMYKDMAREGFYYDSQNSVLSQNEAVDSIWIARGLDGDEIIYRSAQTSGFYVLPRQSDVIQKFGNMFAEVMDWFASSGVLYMPTKFKWFCTFQDRCRLRLVTSKSMSHVEAMALLNNSFGVNHAEIDKDEKFSHFFSKKIGGHTQVYSDSSCDVYLDIHHDLDSDVEVCRVAERAFKPLGFRVIEHYRPKNSA